MHETVRPPLQQLRAKLRSPEPFQGLPGQFLRASDSGSGGREAGALGTYAKSSSPPPSSTQAKKAEKATERRRELRFERFELLSEARYLLMGEGRRQGLEFWHKIHRTAGCKWLRRGDVAVNKNADGHAHYTGLVQCGSAWSCPICAAKIQEQRRQEIAQAVDWAYKVGLQPVLVTLTFPHRAWHRIDDLLEQQRDALARLRSGKAWQKIKQRYAFQGLIRSLEITHGKNGWHPHTHELWFIKRDADAEALAGEVRRRWRASCERAGLLDDGDTGFDEHAVDVKGWCSASDYLAKQDDSRHWGIDREVAKGGSKRGKGVHPFGLLRRSMDGCERSGRLFVDYSLAMKGKRQLFWSHGLKKRVGIEEVDDVQAAETEADEIEVLGQLEPLDWRLVCDYRQRAQLLDAAEKGGWKAVKSLLSGLWQKGRAPDGADSEKTQKAVREVQPCSGSTPWPELGNRDQRGSPGGGIAERRKRQNS